MTDMYVLVKYMQVLAYKRHACFSLASETRGQGPISKFMKG